MDMLLLLFFMITAEIRNQDRYKSDVAWDVQRGLILEK